MRYALVTGASSGIGLETARGLTSRFDVVGLVGRDEKRLSSAAKDLAGNSASIETFVADFSSLAAVQRLAGEVKQRFSGLNALVNNAGVWHTDDRVQSKDGYEDTFAVNHLAHFLLTMELEEHLKSSAPSRVVVVSSSFHRHTKNINFDDLMFESGWTGVKAYRQSKLANVLFSNELARRWAVSGVTANSVHPGNVQTNIVRDNRFLQWALDSRVATWFVKTAAQGAAASIMLASDQELEGVTGQYFHESKQRSASKAALDEETAQRLWKASEVLIHRALGRS